MKAVYLITCISVLCCFLNGTTFAQSVVIRVSTIDKTTKDKLSHVSVVSNGTLTKQTVYTNGSGIAFLTVSLSDSLKVRVSQASYGTQEREVKWNKNRKYDTISMEFTLLFQQATNLAGVTVKPAGVPDTVYRSEQLSVNDYGLLPDGRMVLLTYERTMKKGTELLLFDGLRVQSDLAIEEPAQSLVRDFRGNIHALTANHAFGIQAKENAITIVEMDKPYFMTYLAPIVDTSVTKMFFSNYQSHYPQFDYFAFDRLDSTYRKIANIEDTFMMELYRSEYKWVDVRTRLWARDKERETGVDAEIWVGANYFTQSIYYKALYAPMFKKADTLYVFDHYRNWLYRYNDLGNIIDSLPIFHHLQPKQTGWKKQLIQDYGTGQVYVLYEKAGKTSLRRIDLQTGELKELIPLHFKYPENIQVQGNRVYYVYRPFESAQKKFLYSERLPFRY